MTIAKIGERWGRWCLAKSEPLSLDIYPYGSQGPYDIMLTRLNTPAKVLSWVYHMSGKTWIEKQDLRDFVQACRDLLQAGLLPPGEKGMDEDWGY